MEIHFSSLRVIFSRILAFINIIFCSLVGIINYNGWIGSHYPIINIFQFTITLPSYRNNDELNFIYQRYNLLNMNWDEVTLSIKLQKGFSIIIDINNLHINFTVLPLSQIKLTSPNRNFKMISDFLQIFIPNFQCQLHNCQITIHNHLDNSVNCNFSKLFFQIKDSAYSLYSEGANITYNNQQEVFPLLKYSLIDINFSEQQHQCTLITKIASFQCFYNIAIIDLLKDISVMINSAPDSAPDTNQGHDINKNYDNLPNPSNSANLVSSHARNNNMNHTNIVRANKTEKEIRVHLLINELSINIKKNSTSHDRNDTCNSFNNPMVSSEEYIKLFRLIQLEYNYSKLESDDNSSNTNNILQWQILYDITCKELQTDPLQLQSSATASSSSFPDITNRISSVPLMTQQSNSTEVIPWLHIQFNHFIPMTTSMIANKPLHSFPSSDTIYYTMNNQQQQHHPQYNLTIHITSHLISLELENILPVLHLTKDILTSLHLASVIQNYQSTLITDHSKSSYHINTNKHKDFSIHNINHWEFININIINSNVVIHYLSKDILKINLNKIYAKLDTKKSFFLTMDSFHIFVANTTSITKPYDNDNNNAADASGFNNLMSPCVNMEDVSLLFQVLCHSNSDPVTNITTTYFTTSPDISPLSTLPSTPSPPSPPPCPPYEYLAPNYSAKYWQQWNQYTLNNYSTTPATPTAATTTVQKKAFTVEKCFIILTNDILQNISTIMDAVLNYHTNNSTTDSTTPVNATTIEFSDRAEYTNQITTFISNNSNNSSIMAFSTSSIDIKYFDISLSCSNNNKSNLTSNSNSNNNNSNNNNNNNNNNDKNHHKYSLILNNGIQIITNRTLSSKLVNELSIYIKDNISITHESYTTQNNNINNSKIVKILEFTIEDDPPSLSTSTLQDQPPTSILLFQRIIAPLEIYTSSNNNISIGQLYSCNYINNIKNISLKIDPIFITPIIEIFAQFKSSRSNPEVIIFNNNQPLHQIDNSSKNSQIPIPTKIKNIIHINIKSIKLLLTYNYTPISLLTLQKLEYYNIRYFYQVSQSYFQFSHLVVIDESFPNSTHKLIISNITTTAGASGTTTSKYKEYTPNKIQIDLFFSRELGCILKCQLSFLKVLYLQRVLMTLLVYIRDHCIRSLRDIYNSIAPNVRKSNLTGTHLHSQQPNQQQSVSIQPVQKSSFLLFLHATETEIHLPCNSCSKDGLCFLIPHIEVMKLVSNKYDSNNNEKYTSILRQINEGSNYKIIKQLLFHQDSFHSSLHEAINDVKMTSSIESKCSVLSYELPLHNNLQITLKGSRICTWCSDTPISFNSELLIECTVSLEPVLAEPDGIYSNVFSSLGFHQPAIATRNTSHVTVTISNLNWLLTQGQYLAIYYFIEQNFGESIKGIPETFIPPVLKSCFLTDSFYDSSPIEQRLPKLLLLKILINNGKLTITENSEEYYHKLHNNNIEADTLPPPAKVNFSDEYLTVLDATATATEREISPIESIPIFSYHHQLREQLFSQYYVHDTLLYPASFSSSSSLDGDSRYYDESPHNIHNSHNNISNNNNYKKDKYKINAEIFPIISITFQQLLLDFIRRHHGGGNEIDVSAEVFTIQNISRPITDIITYLTNIDAPPSSVEFPSVNSRNLDNVEPKEKQQLQPIHNAEDINEREKHLPQDILFSLQSNNSYFNNNINNNNNNNNNNNPIFATNSSTENFKDESYKDSQEGKVVDRTTTPLSFIPFQSAKEMNDSLNTNSTTSIDHNQRAIRYTQQGVRNLRRCVFQLAHSVFILHPSKYTEIVSFFTEPVRLSSQREETYQQKQGRSRVEYKLSLDVEIISHNVHVGFPQQSIGTTGNDKMSTKLLMATVDIVSKNAWRGFVSEGPARIHSILEAKLCRLYITSSQDILPEMVTSLLDPFKIRLLRDMKVTPTASQRELNFNLLRSHLHWEDINVFEPFRDKLVRATKSISLEIFTGHEVVEADDDEIEDAEEVAARKRYSFSPNAQSILPTVLQCRVSLLDIQFVTTTLSQLRNAIDTIPRRMTLEEMYFPLFTDFTDIQHLPMRISYLVHTQRNCMVCAGDAAVAVMSLKTESSIDICDIMMKIKNNIYNSKIALFELCNGSLSISKSRDSIHLAGNALLRVWSHNDLLEHWEPVIEGLDVTAISATDQSHGAGGGEGVTSTTTTTSPTPQKLRFEVFCKPIEITLSYNMLHTMVRKLALADVVTINSTDLPPYKISNQLGTSLRCEILMSNTVMASSDLLNGETTAIDIRSLGNSSIPHHHKILSEDDQHLLSISFSIDSKTYESKNPVPMNSEGLVFMLLREVASDGKNLRSHSKLTKKVNEDIVPCVYVNISVTDDGSTYLELRSMIVIENLTFDTCYVSLRKGNESRIQELLPGDRWPLPIAFAHPSTSVYLRRSENQLWQGGVSAFGSLICSGKWGLPTKLKAELCICSSATDNATITTLVATTTNNDSKHHDIQWTCLLQPEVIDPRTSAKGERIPLKFPAADTNTANAMSTFPTQETAYNIVENSINDFGLSFDRKLSDELLPMTLLILSPLQLSNLLPQPLLYRIADREGLLANEGLLLPGQLVDFHKVPHNFRRRLYISIRLANYCWSSWIKVFSQSSPFPTSEKTTELPLSPMELNFEGKELLMPTLSVNIVMIERYVRITCPLRICNYTGVRLGFRDGPTVGGVISGRTVGTGGDNGDEKGVYLPSDSHSNMMTVITKALQGNARNTSNINDGNMSAQDFSDCSQQNISTIPSYLKPNRKRTLSTIHIDNQSVPITVYLSDDHYQRLIIHAQSDWSLQDVLHEVLAELFQRNRGSGAGISTITTNISTKTSTGNTMTDPSNKCRSHLLSYLKPSDYVFFNHPMSELLPAWIENPPSMEEALFGTSLLRSTPTPTSTNTMPSTSIAGATAAINSTTGNINTSIHTKQGSSLSSAYSLLSGGSSSSSASFSSSYLAANRSDLPHNLRYGMQAPCAQNPLSMTTLVKNMISKTIRMTHLSELDIFLQVCSLKSEVLKKEGTVLSMLGWQKYLHRSPFIMFRGSIPYNPPSMLGLSPTFNMRVLDESDWSESITISTTDYHVVSNTLTASIIGIEKRYSKTETAKKVYDFGIQVEYGKGAFNKIKTVSISPRYIFISKLKSTISIRQVDSTERSHIVTLLPDHTMAYHFPFSDRLKYIQIQLEKSVTYRKRNASSSSSSENQQESHYHLAKRDEEEEEEESSLGIGIAHTRSWSGEFNISLIGSFHVKLRDPLSFLKVQVEAVGGSLIATFSEEAVQWPPYRLQNLTSFGLKFRQYSSKNTSLKNWVNSDFLSARSSCSFAWDYPHTGNKVLQIEFEQDVKWESVELPVDEIVKPVNIKLKRRLPDFKDASIEGYLKKRVVVSDTVLWQLCYCILYEDVLYIFKDDTKKELIGVLSLSQQQSQSQSSSDNNNNSNNNMMYASVTRYVEKPSEFLSPFPMYSLDTTLGYFNPYSTTTISQELLSSSSTTALDSMKDGYTIDVNSLRSLLLRLIIDLKLLSSYLTHKNIISNSRQSTSSSLVGSKGHREEIRKRSKESNNLNLINIDVENSMNLIGNQYPQQSPMAIGGTTLSSSNSNLTTVKTPMTTTTIDVATADVVAKLLLEEDIDSIFDYIHSHCTLSLRSLLLSLQSIGEADDEDEAIDLCKSLISQNVIVAASTSNASNTTTSTTTHRNRSNTSSPRANNAADKPTHRSTTSSPNIFKSPTLSTTTHTMVSPSSHGQKGLLSALLSLRPGNDLWINLHVPSLHPYTENDPLDDNDGRKHLYVNDITPKHTIDLSETIKTDASVNESSTTNLPITLPNDVDVDDDDKWEELANRSFTIRLNLNESISLQCPSLQLFDRWVFACRKSIEISTIRKHLQVSSPYYHQSNLVTTMESLETSVEIRVYSDGPTRVLYLSESGGMMSDISSSAKIGLTNHDVTVASSSPSSESLTSIPSLHVILSMASIGLSLVDAEPAEIVYFSLRDIFMSFDYVPANRLIVSLTVQHIQADNQLISPFFPIALSPRRVLPSTHAATATGAKLMLPGLHQLEGTFPTLHIFMQQKLNDGVSNSMSHTTTKRVSIVQYFDMVSLWIAPMELQIDEETLVRIIRIFRDLRPRNQSNNRTLLKSGQWLSGLFFLSSNEEKVNSDSVTCRGVADVESWSLSYSQQLLEQQGMSSYYSFLTRSKPSKSVYFALLQLHPVDMIVTFKSTPAFKLNATEENLISMAAQLDAVRLCLNALVAEHAFGTSSFIVDVIMKHYRMAFLKQLHKLIGSTDIVEGSVGLVANLGTGVYDFFYEPIDGLLDENGSFLKGLSKGGKSLATRTIGGTSAFTSKITGGLGKGMSILTLDSEFQVMRAKKKLKTAQSISEGLYVGTKELSHGIVEGVTGIVTAPYKGWVEDGGRGLSIGIAKGLLGAALKPAVGVFDFASRATEGIRYSAFSSLDPHMDYHRGLDQLTRIRPTRSFGRGGLLLPYHAEAAAAQLVVDKLTGFKKENRFVLVHHLGLERSLNLGINFNRIEMSGMLFGISYLALVSPSRIVLVGLLPTSNKLHLEEEERKVSFIWSCPAECIEQLYSDSVGDLILTVNTGLHSEGKWSDSYPVVIDTTYQDYVNLQLVLEQIIGVKLARQQPLLPVGGKLSGTMLKKYVTGLKSVLLSNTKHTYQLYGHALYEYTHDDKSNAASSAKTSSHTHPSSNLSTSSHHRTDTAITKTTTGWAPPLGLLTCVYPLYDIIVEDPKRDDGDRYFIRILRKTYGMNLGVARRNDQEDRLKLAYREDLILVCASLKSAWIWKKGLEEQSINFVANDLKTLTENHSFKKVSGYSATMHSAFQSSSSIGNSEEYDIETSILSILTLPTAGCDQREVETLKIEIAKTLSAIRR